VPFACVQTVAPATEPVSVDVAKSHLRVTWASDDAYIAAMLAGARAAAEREAGIQLVTATFALTLDDFPRACGVPDGPRRAGSSVRLPVGPVVAVDSVAYRDFGGTVQTLAPTSYDVGVRTGRLVPIVFWPIVYPYGLENVTVTFRAGYGGAAQVPADAVAAILLILADRYQNRGDNVTNFLADRAIPAAALRLLRNLGDGRQW
jgi:uncharacterized phiE125 gp8 family phage protein